MDRDRNIGKRAFWAFVGLALGGVLATSPGGCSTVDGLGKDIRGAAHGVARMMSED